MRRLIVLVVGLLTVPATSAVAADLGELLDRSREASYSAEQVISCLTPDGVESGLVSIAQLEGDVYVGSSVDGAYSVASGFGGWTLFQQGDAVTSTAVDEADTAGTTDYEIDEGVPTEFLGRDATQYRMFGEGLLRAELVTDDDVGALLRVITYGSDGEVYCERRFISFDATPPALAEPQSVEPQTLQSTAAPSTLPEALGGFTRLDLYADEDGFVFAYYSDGFFSFAVFETPSVVQLDDPSVVSFDGGSYDRAFTPGQVTYSWERPSGGMALIGDLPPDMHEAILEVLPEPDVPGLFRRIWRSLFG